MLRNGLSLGFAFLCFFRWFGIKDCHCMKIGFTIKFVMTVLMAMGIYVRKLRYGLYTNSDPQMCPSTHRTG